MLSTPFFLGLEGALHASAARGSPGPVERVASSAESASVDGGSENDLPGARARQPHRRGRERHHRQRRRGPPLRGFAGAGAVVLKSLFEERIAEQSASLEQGTRRGDASGGPRLPESGPRLEARSPAVSRPRARRRAQAVDDPGDRERPLRERRGGWVPFAKRIESAGADAIELNLSHFTKAGRRELARRREALRRTIVATVAQSLRHPGLGEDRAPLHLSVERPCPNLVDAGSSRARPVQPLLRGGRRSGRTAVRRDRRPERAERSSCIRCGGSASPPESSTAIWRPPPASTTHPRSSRRCCWRARVSLRSARSSTVTAPNIWACFAKASRHLARRGGARERSPTSGDWRRRTRTPSAGTPQPPAVRRGARARLGLLSVLAARDRLGENTQPRASPWVIPRALGRSVSGRTAHRHRENGASTLGFASHPAGAGCRLDRGTELAM